MTEYLLDTSLIRSLNTNEEQEIIRRKGTFSLTASYVVPLELLSGSMPPKHPMAEKENGLRKAALIRYYKLVGLDNTYWEDENIVTLKAFGISLPNTDRSDIKQLIRDYAEAQDLDEVEIRYTQLLNVIRQWDSDKISDYLPALESMHQGVEKVLTLGDTVDEKTALLLASAISSWFAYLKSWGVSKSTLSALENILGSMTHEDIWKLAEVLRSKYDGSLDLFIKFWPEYLKQRRTFERADKKKKNDVFDWEHIFCLRVDDVRQVFVTGDGFLRDLVKTVAPDRILGKDDLFNRICVAK